MNTLFALGSVRPRTAHNQKILICISIFNRPDPIPQTRMPFDDSTDEEANSIPDLEAVREAEIVNEDSVVRNTEWLRLVFWGSTAQSSNEPPIPNAFMWSSSYGPIASVSLSDASFPVATSLSIADAELYGLAQAMGQIPVLGATEDSIGVVSVGTQTEFVHVLFPLGLLVDSNSVPYPHPHATYPMDDDVDRRALQVPMTYQRRNDFKPLSGSF